MTFIDDDLVETRALFVDVKCVPCHEDPSCALRSKKLSIKVPVLQVKTERVEYDHLDLRPIYNCDQSELLKSYLDVLNPKRTLAVIILTPIGTGTR